MGKDIDGGYIVVDKDLDKLEAIYGVGIRDETSLEEHFLKEYPQIDHV